MHKNTLTDENWEVKSHSKREVLDAKKKRKKTATNKKAKKLGLKILDANENVQAYIKKYLRDATKEDQSTSPNTLRLQNDQEIEIPVPTQGDISISEYFESIKLYAITQNKDLDDFNVKIDFIIRLSHDNTKHVKEFGFEKPLKEIVEYLVGQKIYLF
ncbi:hypothetical protein RclHR1_11520003 [Rhizophagus clarus]|uniref:Uncharacterized protein n=1 Tax=Rhizophagus clarus TaxID=94130 RepID=A0A2Z6Q5W7_9GLOM|nr:hypothetical protein RclHR1_11520003 [Rhizophagus clarus]